jgi:hypothetical protein
MTTTQPAPVASIGVGIDTSRYGHHVSFLRDDLQPATEPMVITEAKQGYNKLLNTLRDLKRCYPNVVFQIRLDEAGQYAANLRMFLYTLPFEKTVSIGDCVRNNNYRAAHFPKRKADAVDSLSVARSRCWSSLVLRKRFPCNWVLYEMSPVAWKRKRGK